MISFSSDPERQPSQPSEGESLAASPIYDVRSRLDVFVRAGHLRIVSPDWRVTAAQRSVIRDIQDIAMRLEKETAVDPHRPGAEHRVENTCIPPVSEKRSLWGALADVYRSIAGRLSNDASGAREGAAPGVSEPSMRSAEQIVLSRRAMLLFDRSLRNVEFYGRNEPLELTGEEDLHTVLCSPSSDEYEREFVGSLWAIQTAWYAFRNDEQMLRAMFAVMRGSLGETHAVLLNGKVYDWLLLELIDIARRSETFKTVLLDQEWLGFNEADLGPPYRSGLT